MKPGETIGRFAIDELVASTETCELHKAVGWELDTCSSSDENLFSERLSTQSMPVIQIKRLTEETQRTKD